MVNRELIRQKVLQLLYAYYQNKGKTRDVAMKELTYSLDKAYELYEYLLTVLVEVRKYAERKAEATQSRAQRLHLDTDGKSKEQVLAENKFLLQLEDNEALQDYRTSKTDWEEEPLFFKQLCEQFVGSDIFSQYLEAKDFSYEADKNLIKRLYKTFVFDNEPLDTMLEEHGLYWNDDKVVIDSFILKTVKRFEEQNGAKQELLPQYTTDDDRVFAEELFSKAIDLEADIYRLIQDNLKNWEFERLTFMDVIITQMAITELLSFPSIPINVTFNEYINLAKYYSTGKSSKYINGLLDQIVKVLREQGRLLKA